MKQLLIILVVLMFGVGCSVYRFEYNIALTVDSFSEIGDIELLLETTKDRSDTMDADVSPELDLSLPGL